MKDLVIHVSDHMSAASRLTVHVNRLVLRHLQAEWEAANIEDWNEDGLVAIFNQFQSKL